MSNDSIFEECTSLGTTTIASSSEIPSSPGLVSKVLCELLMSSLKPNLPDLQTTPTAPIPLHNTTISYQHPWNPMGEVEKATAELSQISAFTAQEERLVLTTIIAKGGFGTVHRGRWRGLDVAVKTILFNRLDTERRNAVSSEAALATSMSVHPNVVSTFHYEFKPIKTVRKRADKVLESLVIIENKEDQQDLKLYLIQASLNMARRWAVCLPMCHRNASLIGDLPPPYVHDKTARHSR